MFERLSRLFDENIRNWRSLTPARRAGVVAVLVGGGVFFFLAGWVLLTQERYVPLFPGALDTESTAEIVAVLERNNIPHRLGGIGGAQILVPGSLRARAQSLTAQEGALAGADRAFDFLDESQFGTIDAVLTLKNKRAKERQLRMVLQQFKFIRAADVILVPEEKELMDRDYRPAQASVVLDTRGSPDPAAVQGVADLVRLSLPGLKEENIVITNRDGIQLNRRKRDALLDRASEQYELIEAEQEAIRQKIVRHLDGVLGVGNAIVTVAIDKDFDVVEHAIHDIDTSNPGEVSRQRTRESSTSAAPGGEPGVGSNIPNTAVAGVGDAGGRREFEDQIANFVFATTDTKIKKAVGQTRHLSAAVTVNHRRLRDSAGRVTDQYEPRSSEELEELKSQILHALRPVSGGNVELALTQMLFDRTSDAAARQEAAAAERLEQILQYWVPFLGMAAILVGLALLLWYNSARTLRLQQRRAQAEMERALAETRARREGLSLLELGIGEVSDISQLPPEEQRRIKLAQKVEEFCNTKPEEVAAIVKTWLAE